ncbi:TetR/AcrR family transcriptional regulator [Acuticoccus sp. M5D2P5]|uniref:TetR/AcrR family transcriptional regulator n=1 Tax=Acuticoccus kalidii TaxID=2910977 RepID=UPI001F1D00A0|nr:TetR/AcrR family transcriptional regulator [Acuticoccus kalidii]MCF3934072.1 TetR/AcrR family transcriptional regulator [Acuticoccus kalidii]
MTTAPPSVDVREHILSTAHLIMSGKGFSGVGLNEILRAAHVPKGSFYHYFASKEAFGEALLTRYFEHYLKQMDETFDHAGNGRDQLVAYFEMWAENQSASHPESNCLVVKLAAEVSDLSDTMRRALKAGTDAIVARLTGAVTAGQRDGSIGLKEPAAAVALSLYQSWLGASLIAKIAHNDTPLAAALAETRHRLAIT